MDGPWLLVQRRRLANALGPDAGGERLSIGGCVGRDASLSRSLMALEVERGEGPLCEID